MVSIDLIFAIVFYGLVLIIFFKTRKKWDVQRGILALYRTKFGLKFMDKFAKKDSKKSIRTTGIILTIISILLILYGIFISKSYLTGIGLIILIIALIMAIPLKWIGHFGTTLGFAGMVFIFFMLLKSSLDLFLVPGTQPTVAPVLPGVSIPGLPVLSFWHWIISIFLLAIVHEFAHGIFAREHKIKVKSSGIGFLGPILLAFVEPDEKQTAKAKKSAQLSIFAAGPFANFVLGAISLITFLLILGPAANSIFDFDGISVGQFTEGFPAEKSGLEVPFKINSVDGVETLSLVEFIDETEDLKPNEELTLGTDQGTFTIATVENPNNASRGYIGIEAIQQETKTKENISPFLGSAFSWVSLLVMWLFFINVGVGLFNLLPLGPVDGGRMFHVAALKIFKKEKTAKKAWIIAMYAVLFLIFINFIPWLAKLGKFTLGFLS